MNFQIPGLSSNSKVAGKKLAAKKFQVLSSSTEDARRRIYFFPKSSRIFVIWHHSSVGNEVLPAGASCERTLQTICYFLTANITLLPLPQNTFVSSCTLLIASFLCLAKKPLLLTFFLSKISKQIRFSLYFISFSSVCS